MPDWSTYEARLGAYRDCVLVDSDGKVLITVDDEILLASQRLEQRDRVIARERERILRKSLLSPALKTVSVDDDKIYLFIHSTDKENEKDFNTLPGSTINSGDIIDWQEMHWLVTKIDFDDEISRSGHIVQCNRQIRWQNKNTYETINRWCVFNSSATFSIDGSDISTSDKEYEIWVPYDDETKLVDLDWRIMPDIINGKPRTYKCTGVDQNTKLYSGASGGIIILKFTQDESLQPNDRTDLMICDYIEPPTIPDPSPTLLKCEISGRSNIRVGINRKYTAVFYDEDGTSIITGITPVWTITKPTGYENYVTWTQNDGFIEISVSDDRAIGQKINIELVDEDELYAPATMEVEVIDTI